MVVGPHCTSGPAAYDEVIATVNGSPLSEEVLPLATSWAKALDLKMQIVEVVDPDAIEQAEAAGVPVDDVHETAHVAHLAADLEKEGVNASWEVLHNTDAAQGITSHPFEHPAAIVAMTTPSYSGLSLLTMGSVATRVVHESKCLVLLLRPASVTDSRPV